jgi:regulator of protease activity HflC (stomatin/prohibitin superfamily)
MAEIRKFPIWRHLRGDPNFHVLRFRRGVLCESARGPSFWFHPMNASIVEVPMDDRELPFLYHARSRDFQDVTVQGVISFRVTEPEKLAERVDFSIDLATGLLKEQPMDKLAALVTELAQQSTWDYLVHTELVEILEHGFEEIRTRIGTALDRDESLESMGLEIVAVRIAAVRPEPEVEKALRTPTRESIQQHADEATFQRRALAVEKERAIQENELQNQIELSRREAALIEQQGQNERNRAREHAQASLIKAESRAEQSTVEARAKADNIESIEQARVNAESQRMNIYRDFPSEMLLGLAADKLAGKLQRIEHLNLTPDLLGGMLTRLMHAGTDRLEERKDA